MLSEVEQNHALCSSFSLKCAADTYVQIRNVDSPLCHQTEMTHSNYVPSTPSPKTALHRLDVVEV
jgi:hypothetical protein